MSKQYYLVSSLPSLVMGEKPFYEREAFLEECEKWLTGEEMRSVKSARYGKVQIRPFDVPAVRRWKRVDAVLRAGLEESRKKRRNKESAKSGNDIVSRVLEKGDPLQRELTLENIRWHELTGMELDYFFDINSLAIYYLKLQIAERVAAFDKEKGHKKFCDQCEELYDKANR